MSLDRVHPGKGGHNGQYPHTQSSGNSSAQQLGVTGTPGTIPSNNQIRIRKDPIKHTPNYKKPPSLAVYEEALMKKTGGSNLQAPQGMVVKQQTLRDVNNNQLGIRQGEHAQALSQQHMKLSMKSHQQVNMHLDRSPDLKKS